MRCFGPIFAALLLLAAPARCTAQTGAPRSVVIFTSDGRDRRIDAVRQAVASWNRTLSNLSLKPAFLEPQVIVSPRVSRTLQTYATRISKDGWKPDREISPDAPGLVPPSDVTTLSGDLIVLLSTQPILSFSWPIGGAARYFIAIRSDRIPPLEAPNAARNVIAHELGHTLGLVHNADPAMLMCGSCDMSGSKTANADGLPLTASDRARLRSGQS
jgi:hypothetical protein